MNDRFKLRYWDKQIKKMRYGDIQLSCNGLPFTLEVTSKGVRAVDIDNVEIMQCTGLKDKNGKLIYEGDIIKLNDKYPDYSVIDDFYKNQNFVVEYFQPQAVYLLKPFELRDYSGDGIYDLSPDFYEFINWHVNGIEYGMLQGIEIIGNFYENPELLEVQNERIL